MTTGRPDGGSKLWRDLAASVVQDVADRVRASAADAEAHARARMDPSVPHRVSASPPTAPTAPGKPPALGRELKHLVAQGLRATNDSISEYQSERERRKVEAPMRRAQSRATAAKVGAAGMGVLAVSLLAGGAGSIAMEMPEYAVPPLVMTVGAGAGTVALSRRGRRYQDEADRYAQRLGAASASAISIHGASAYTIPMPSPSSLAYDPTRRLVAQKAALAELLTDVSEIAPELGPLAEESERTLSAYADRIVKLERAQQAASGSTSLDAPLARAVEQYEDGVDAHKKLVEAAATVMAELSTPHIPDTASVSISDAADRLQGLAQGLREVRSDITIDDPLPPSPSRTTEPVAEQPRPARPRPSKRAHRGTEHAG
ncbi:hypothetical protein [Blastococcus sp. Marseille-P5729]|uniref:phage shock envelope stress response protein PspM n=1 Tax=Blastococcus sp. Marseille-P5729 TaxID=2086582 RepID=UPI000D0FEE14|nr:hypothetical protein [Blastococcus sp. Marseille-P5729]